MLMASASFPAMPQPVRAQQQGAHLSDLEHFGDTIRAWRHPHGHTITPFIAKAIVRHLQQQVSACGAAGG